MNLSERLIKAGFVPDTVGGSAFNPKNNWLGVSIQHPDCFLDRGDRTVHISVQGLAMPVPVPLTNEMLNLLHSRNARYIGFSINKVKVYETWTGEIPSDEFINEFIR